MTKDALDELIVEEEKGADVDLLADILKNYLRLSKSGEILFESNFYDLTEFKKAMLFILSRKAIFVKKLNNKMKECVTQKEISEKAFIPHKNVSKVIKRLKNFVIEKEKGCYIILNYNLIKCKKFLEENSEHKKK